MPGGGKVAGVVALLAVLGGMPGAPRAEDQANPAGSMHAPSRSEPTASQECDRLAAPIDPSARDSGIEFLKIEVEAAVAACTAAAREHPDGVRFVYQLGRAHDAGRRYDQARELYAAAADAATQER